MAKRFNLPKLVTGFLILCCAVCSINSQHQIDPEVEKKINEFIENVYFPESNITSLVLTIVRGDDIFYTNGYGLADIEKEIPNGNETQYNIGSISKVNSYNPGIRIN